MLVANPVEVTGVFALLGLLHSTDGISMMMLEDDGLFSTEFGFALWSMGFSAECDACD